MPGGSMTAIDDLNERLDEVQASLDEAQAKLDEVRAAVDDLTDPVEPPPEPTVPGAGVVDSSEFTKTGAWSVGSYPAATGGSDLYSNVAGAKLVTPARKGRTFVLYGTKAGHHGTAFVKMDDAPAPQAVSFKASTRQENVEVARWTLADGPHVIEIQVAGDGVVAVDRLTVDVTAPVPVPPDPIPVPPDPPPAGTFALKVNGNKLVGADGKQILLRGTNFYVDSYPEAGQMPHVSKWHDDKRDVIAAELAGYGVNWVAIPVNNVRTDAYVARLKRVTDAHKARGIWTVLRPFGSLPGGWQPSAASGQLAVDLWNLLGKPPHVLLDTVNEPNPGAYSDTEAAWLSGTRAAITAIRNGGYAGPIFCDCRRWAWTIPVAEAKQLQAQDSQLVFMSHRYSYTGSASNGPADIPNWVNEWKAAAGQGLAVGVGEFGWYNGGGNQAIGMQWCQAMANAIVQGMRDGWLAGATSWIWCWDGNSHIVGANTGGDWWPITQGEPWKLNQQGQISKGFWQQAAAIPVT